MLNSFRWQAQSRFHACVANSTRDETPSLVISADWRMFRTTSVLILERNSRALGDTTAEQERP